MRAAEAEAGAVRHDISIADSMGGKIIGHGGATYRELKAATNCNVFVLLKEGAPPGFTKEQRLVILIGRPEQVKQILVAKGSQGSWS